LPNVGPYIYDVSISGFTRSSIYIYDISSLRVKIISHSIAFQEYVFYLSHTYTHTHTRPNLEIFCQDCLKQFNVPYFKIREDRETGIEPWTTGFSASSDSTRIAYWHRFTSSVLQKESE